MPASKSWRWSTCIVLMLAHLSLGGQWTKFRNCAWCKLFYGDERNFRSTRNGCPLDYTRINTMKLNSSMLKKKDKKIHFQSFLIAYTLFQGRETSLIVGSIYYAAAVSTFSVWSPLKVATLTCETKVYNLLAESSSSLRIRANRTRILKGTPL